jgi:hypothetical protein
MRSVHNREELFRMGFMIMIPTAIKNEDIIPSVIPEIRALREGDSACLFWDIAKIAEMIKRTPKSWGPLILSPRKK